MNPPDRTDPTAGAQRARPAFRDWVLGLALAALLLQFLFAAWVYWQHAGAALAFPYPLEYQEGLTLDRALRLAQGQNPYPRDISSPPFTATYRPPLFWLLQTPFVSLFGPAFWYGRAVAILSAWAAAALIGLMLFTITRDLPAAVIGGGTLIAFPLFAQGSALNQPDSMALPLSLGGLYVVLRRPEGARPAALAAALFALAIFTHRAYFLAAPLAALAWLLQRRQPRQALTLLGMLALFCLAGFALIDLLTGGGFHLHLFAYDARPFSWRAVTAAFSRFFPEVFYLVVGVVLYLAAERFGSRTQTWPLVMPFFLGGLAAALFIGRAGAGDEALFPLAAALSLAAGAIFNWVRRTAWVNALLAALLALQINAMINRTRADVLAPIQELRAQQADLTELYSMVQQAGGRVLADTYAGLLPLSGHPVLFQPVEFGYLEAAGRWDNRALIGQIDRQEFAYIFFHIPADRPQALAERWSPAVREAVYNRYQQTGRVSSVYIWTPRP